MDFFPDTLVPSQRCNFPIYKKNLDLSFWRKRIIDYIFSGKRDGFDLKSPETKLNGYTCPDDDIVDTIREELENLGWKTRLAYGKTTLFIFECESELPPMSEAEEIDG